MTRRTLDLALLTGWMLATCAVATQQPVPLADAASSAPRLASPAGDRRIEVAAGANSARIEDRTAPDKPTTYRFEAPGGQMVTIGVSSPKADVRIAIFLAESGVAVGGAGRNDGAIRWTSSFRQSTELMLLAYVETEETPFRFEISFVPSSED